MSSALRSLFVLSSFFPLAIMLSVLQFAASVHLIALVSSNCSCVSSKVCTGIEYLETFNDDDYHDASTLNLSTGNHISLKYKNFQPLGTFNSVASFLSSTYCILKLKPLLWYIDT
jgi:hypothetical protein